MLQATADIENGYSQPAWPFLAGSSARHLVALDLDDHDGSHRVVDQHARGRQVAGAILVGLDLERPVFRPVNQVGGLDGVPERRQGEVTVVAVAIDMEDG